MALRLEVLRNVDLSLSDLSQSIPGTGSFVVIDLALIDPALLRFDDIAGRLTICSFN